MWLNVPVQRKVIWNIKQSSAKCWRVNRVGQSEVSGTIGIKDVVTKSVGDSGYF